MPDTLAGERVPLAARGRTIMVVVVVLVAVAWVAFAYVGGDSARELRRALVNPTWVPWPPQTVQGSVVHAASWDSELPSIQLTVKADDGRIRVLVLNDNSAVRSGEVAFMPGMIGKRVTATAKPLLPWPAPEYFVQSLVVSAAPG